MNEGKEIILTQEELRKLQMEELEILKEVDRICRKNKIPYFLSGGTMLGAVRHKGFIPWDDDVDVSMLRENYNKFCLACEKDLNTERFFLQTWDTDINYRYQYGRMRKNNTKYIRSGHENAKHHNGINIDIFPVDAVPDNKILCIIYKTGCALFRKILYSPVGAIRTKNILIRKIYAALSRIDRDAAVNGFKRWTERFGRFRSARADAVGFAYRLTLKDIKKLGWSNYKEMYCGMKKEMFDDLREYEFENSKFYGPRDYDHYLRVLYGEYMVPPPIEKRNGEHKAVKIQFSDEDEADGAKM